MKVRTIRIYHDRMSMFSDWGIFILSLLFIGIIFVSMLKVITRLDNDAELIALIVFLFTLGKITSFVRLPIHYTTSDLIEDITEPKRGK